LGGDPPHPCQPRVERAGADPGEVMLREDNFSIRSKFVGTELNDLIACCLLTMKRILGKNRIQFFAIEAFGEDDASGSWKLGA